MHAKVEYAFTLLEITDAKLAEFLTAQAVVQERGEDGAIPFALERVSRWSFEEHARLFVTERRCEPLVGI
jgi:hypothetical protein